MLLGRNSQRVTLNLGINLGLLAKYKKCASEIDCLGTMRKAKISLLWILQKVQKSSFTVIERKLAISMTIFIRTAITRNSYGCYILRQDTILSLPHFRFCSSCFVIHIEFNTKYMHTCLY